jgi:GTP pyrophosphokinase
VARSGHTLSKIRKALREEEEKQGIEMGRQILEAELRKRGKNLNRLIRDGAMRAVLRSLDFREPERLYLAIARNHLQPAKVCRELAPDVEWGPARQEPTVESLITRHKAREASPVLIHGEQDLYVTYARCCNPLPGEPVQGFITQGHGISVHAVTCPQLLAMDAERRIAVQWDARVRTQHVGGLRIVCANRPGLLANISSSCEAAGINIHRLEVRPLEDQKAACEMEVGVYGLKDLADLMRRLEKIRGVVSVVRTRA